MKTIRLGSSFLLFLVGLVIWIFLIGVLVFPSRMVVSFVGYVFGLASAVMADRQLRKV